MGDIRGVTVTVRNVQNVWEVEAAHKIDAKDQMDRKISLMKVYRAEPRPDQRPNYRQFMP